MIVTIRKREEDDARTKETNAEGRLCSATVTGLSGYVDDHDVVFHVFHGAFSALQGAYNGFTQHLELLSSLSGQVVVRRIRRNCNW
jgi:hypothetical protein